MYETIMDDIVAAIRRRYGPDRWPSDVEQKLAEISDALRAILD